LDFKVEQKQVPEFLWQKAKDTILVLNFMRCIEDLAGTNIWSNNVTYNDFVNALKGVARKWLFSVVNMVDYCAYQLLWSNLKPHFHKEFAIKSNDKLIIEGLLNLTMRPNEDRRYLLNWITNTMVIIKESYSSYCNKPTTPHHDLKAGWSDATGRKLNVDTISNLMNFFKMQLPAMSDQTQHRRQTWTRQQW